MFRRNRAKVQMDGVITINGRRISPGGITSISAYVQQVCTRTQTERYAPESVYRVITLRYMISPFPYLLPNLPLATSLLFSNQEWITKNL